MEIPSGHSKATQDNQILIILLETYNETSPNYSSRVQVEPKNTPCTTQAMYTSNGMPTVVIRYPGTTRSTKHRLTIQANKHLAQSHLDNKYCTKPRMLHVTDSTHAVHTKENSPGMDMLVDNTPTNKMA